MLVKQPNVTTDTIMLDYVHSLCIYIILSTKQQ